jgi:anti-anti-sigma factor
MLSINHNLAPGAVLLTLKGELRIPQGDQLLIEVVEHFVQSRCRMVLVDLENVTDIDAAGLGALVSARNWVRDAGRRLVLVKPGRRIIELMAITKLLPVFDILAADVTEPSSARTETAPSSSEHRVPFSCEKPLSRRALAAF